MQSQVVERFDRIPVAFGVITLTWSSATRAACAASFASVTRLRLLGMTGGLWLGKKAATPRKHHLHHVDESTPTAPHCL